MYLTRETPLFGKRKEKKIPFAPGANSSLCSFHFCLSNPIQKDLNQSIGEVIANNSLDISLCVSEKQTKTQNLNLN